MKCKLLLEIFGRTLFEAYFADTMLEAHIDGKPRPKGQTADSETERTSNRIYDLLIGEGFLQLSGNQYIITSLGVMHHNNGGYMRQYIRQRIATAAFILGLISFVLSIIAIIRTF